MSKYLSKNVFPEPVEQSAVRQNWQDRGYSCYAITDTPGQQWNDFIHSTDEVLTVVSGRLKLFMDGAEIICEAGDEVFIPRDYAHSVHNINGSPTSWIYGYNQTTRQSPQADLPSKTIRQTTGDTPVEAASAAESDV